MTSERVATINTIHMSLVLSSQAYVYLAMVVVVDMILNDHLNCTLLYARLKDMHTLLCTLYVQLIKTCSMISSGYLWAKIHSKQINVN